MIATRLERRLLDYICYQEIDLNYMLDIYRYLQEGLSWPLSTTCGRKIFMKINKLVRIETNNKCPLRLKTVIKPKGY